MRRIVMFNQVTVDGYFAGRDGNLHWVVPDKEFDKSVTAGLPVVSGLQKSVPSGCSSRKRPSWSSPGP